jgi:hypothetical protein
MQCLRHFCTAVDPLLLTGSWQQRNAAAIGGSWGGREVAAAGGWREVAVALEDVRVKGGGGHNKVGHGFAVPLFLSLLTFSLFTFHFSLFTFWNTRKGRLKKED